jgi:hypothetical protein
MTATHSPEERYLLDREAILDGVSLCCRAIDRQDGELLAGLFHADATVQDRDFTGPLPAYLAWIDTRRSALAQSHNLTSHSCAIDGDSAEAESYVLIASLGADGRTAAVTGGRWLDRFERRDGFWRIAGRRFVTDWSFTADGAESHNPDGYVRGRPDRGDISYQRPLSLSPELMARLRE